MESEEYRAGKEAYYNGASIIDNPFPYYSGEHSDWDAGFKFARNENWKDYDRSETHL